MTQNSSAPAGDAYKEPLSEKINDIFLRNSAYIVLAAIAVTAFLMFGMTALAFVVPTIVFIAVAFFVGSMSENLRHGLIAGVVAALPVALFFLWILK